MTGQTTRSFFETFEMATNSEDYETLVSLYADTFMFGGEQGTQAIKAEDFKIVLPKRKGFFKSVGLNRTELFSLDEIALDEKYIVAKVIWKMTYEKNGHKKIEDEVQATYIVFSDGALSKIVMQIDHQDLTQRVKQLGLV
jgi:hypothetical protein